MRRLDLLISEARQETDNSLFTDETGIQDSEFIRWANSGQSKIISLIQRAHPDLFQRENEIAGVQGQEEYSLPAKTFLGTRVQQIEYSRTGLKRDYYLLKKGSLKERVNGPVGSPSFYIRFSGKFLVQPSPETTGKFRVVTQLALPRIDIKRATVSSAVLNTGNNTITSLTLDTTLNIDASEIISEGYICIVDKDGNILMEGIPVDDVNTTTGVVTIHTGFTFTTGETIPSGSFVVLGNYSSTHSSLPDIAERYLVEFMIWKVEKRDSNNSSTEANQELDLIAADIVDSFSEADEDVSYVPILDSQYMSTDWHRE